MCEQLVPSPERGVTQVTGDLDLHVLVLDVVGHIGLFSSGVQAHVALPQLLPKLVVGLPHFRKHQFVNYKKGLAIKK